jgi:transposase
MRPLSSSVASLSYIKVVNDAEDAIRKEEVRNNPVFKGSRYLFLKNRQNLAKKKRRRFQDLRLSDMNLKTFLAYPIREACQLVYEAKTPRMIERLLRQWYYWATQSRLPQMVKAAKTIRRHWQVILSRAPSESAMTSRRASTPAARLPDPK